MLRNSITGREFGDGVELVIKARYFQPAILRVVSSILGDYAQDILSIEMVEEEGKENGVYWRSEPTKQQRLAAEQALPGCSQFNCGKYLPKEKR